MSAAAPPTEELKATTLDSQAKQEASDKFGEMKDQKLEGKAEEDEEDGEEDNGDNTAGTGE